MVSTAIPGNPGCISRMASSTPRVTSAVFAPRYFCTTRSRPGPSSTTPSPIIGPGSITTWPKSAIRITLPSRSMTGILPICSGSTMGCTLRMLNR